MVLAFYYYCEVFKVSKKKTKQTDRHINERRAETPNYLYA